MRVLFASGHGKIAPRLERLLVARGHDVTGLVRGADVVVLAAVPGPGSQLPVADAVAAVVRR